MCMQRLSLSLLLMMYMLLGFSEPLNTAAAALLPSKLSVSRLRHNLCHRSCLCTGVRF